MIVRTLSLSNEKARIIEDSFNMTSQKQQDAERHFRQNFYVPSDEKFEVTEQIDKEKTINNSEQRINNESVIKPRRSLSKQIELWNQPTDTKEKKIKIITDDYYHESIAVTTNNYLENLRQLVIDCQEKIRKKKEELVNVTTAAIRKQWDDIRVNLVTVVNQWCKRSQEQQLSIFLEEGAVFSSGALSELATRLTNKREEIEVHFSRVVDLYKNNKILKGEDLTKNMLQIKSYLKEIWDKQFQFEIQQLEINVNSLVEQTISLPYQFQEGALMRDLLHRSVDDSLAQFTVFSTFFQNFYKRKEYKAMIARKNQGSVRKNTGNLERDVIVESFVDETMKQLQILKLQRDREWQQLTQKKR